MNCTFFLVLLLSGKNTRSVHPVYIRSLSRGARENGMNGRLSYFHQMMKTNFKTLENTLAVGVGVAGDRAL